MTDKRFDWWRAMAQVLGSIGKRCATGEPCTVLLVRVRGRGTAMAMARSSRPRAIALGGGQGALALFIAFYGSQAAGLLLMDRALGRAPVKWPMPWPTRWAWATGVGGVGVCWP